MTIVIDESITAVHQTAASICRAVFGFDRVIESITIHHWGALGQRFDDVVNYLSIDNDRESSAHFVVMAGKITCLVSPVNASWHAGTSYGNATSIGIECHPEATPEDYAAVAELVRFLRDNYGPNLPLYPHNHWISTACPGDWDLAYINELANGVVAPLSNTGDTKMATFQPSEEYFNAMIGAQARIDIAVTKTNFVKGDQKADIYEIASGQLRYVSATEWKVLSGANHNVSVRPQADIDALLAETKK